MFREKVIITKLPITQAGQIQHFQVKIPRDAERIIGVEVSAQYMNMQLAQTQKALLTGLNTPSQYSFSTLDRKALGKNIFQITPDLFLGDVRLQSCEDTNVFFAENVYYTDENLGFGDFSVSSPMFKPVPETHGYKRHECTVNTNGETTILKGIYRDRQQGANATANSLTGQVFFQYTVSIYVWYTIIIPKP